ncbi:MAG: T9SS type A sorting domain-containing protein, partial [Chitinophagaceae bacterium]|nr:T9SS type A sorting domain-containing protein [Chitinophagaceae bacterium]
VILSGSALKLWWEGAYYSISFDVTGFSGFFVKSASVTLPLNLLAFDGKAVQSGNLLNWKTANEVNFSHFEIERSTDGREFIKIGTQPSNTSGHYEYLDATATTADQYYYRLKMVDRDGRFSNSKIIRINNTGKALVGQAYPNPTTGIASVDINAVTNETWTFSVVDVMGRVLHTFTRNLPKGNHTILLDNLRQGLNYIKIESGTTYELRKVMKH